MSLLKSRRCRRSITEPEEQNAIENESSGEDLRSALSRRMLESDKTDSGDANAGSAASRLGPPMNIQHAATLLGCSTWTIRQRLIPMGLPYFQASPARKLIFYQNQIVHWMETHQKTMALTTVDVD